MSFNTICVICKIRLYKIRCKGTTFIWLGQEKNEKIYHAGGSGDRYSIHL